MEKFACVGRTLVGFALTSNAVERRQRRCSSAPTATRSPSVGFVARGLSGEWQVGSSSVRRLPSPRGGSVRPETGAEDGAPMAMWQIATQMRFHRRHFVAALALFVVEVCIALFARDDFIRPYVGDVLVVPLMLHALATVMTVALWRLTIGVWLFAFAVEFAQYCKLVDALGLQDNRLAATVIGTSFSVEDLVAYSVGAGLAYWLGKRVERRPQ